MECSRTFSMVMLRAFVRLARVVSAAVVFLVLALAASSGSLRAQVLPAAGSAPLDLTHIDVAETETEKPSQGRNFEPRVTIDASLENQYPLGSDQIVPPGNTTGQYVLGGTARLRLFDGIYLFYRRDNHDQVDGATNGTNLSSWAYDIEGDYGLEYAANKNLHFEAYWAYTYRTFSPNAADGQAFSIKSKSPKGPKVEASHNFNAQYFFGPKTRIGRSFLITEEAQLYEHHLDYTISANPAFIKAGNTLDGLPNGPDSKLLWKTTAYYYMPILGQQKVVPYVGYENSASYYNNATQPTFSNRIRWGIVFDLSRFYTFETYVDNDHGYPASASASHNTTLFTALTVHLRS